MAPSGPWLASDMPKESLGDFDNIKWIQDIVHDPDVKEVPFHSRTVFRDSTHHSLFNRTLATNDTLRACQSFLRLRPCKESETPDSEDGRKKESLLIASMGRGLDGYPGFAHGGTIATLFDETLSLVALQVLSMPFMTVYLTTTYKKAVPTAGPVLVRCWCEKFEGRKAWITGTMEDGEGGIYALAEYMFITRKSKL